MQLDVLPDRDIGGTARVLFRKSGDDVKLPRGEKPVGQPDAQHEVGHSLTFATGAAEGARAVTLRVDPPPAEICLDPGLGPRGVALRGEGADLIEAFPGVLLPLESLHLLNLGFS